MEITKAGPFGGRGQWDDGTFTGIRQLHIHSGTVIDAIQIEYDNNGDSVLSDKHGGTGGQTEHHEVKLEYPSEYIISVSGHYDNRKDVGDDVVYSLTIKTNKTAYGPFGTEKGKSFSMSEQDKKIIGFYGVSGVYLDSIGAYLKPINVSDRPRSLGPLGGVGGVAWDDGINDGIKQIVIVAGHIIDSIRIEYENNGESFWSEKHGDSTGGITAVIKLDYPEEFITSVSGYFANLGGMLILSSLTIESNKHRYGPFGKEVGDSFSFQAHKIIGFHGRSGVFIDSIGVHAEGI